LLLERIRSSQSLRSRFLDVDFAVATKFPARVGDICLERVLRGCVALVATAGKDQRSDRMSLNRNSRKQKLLMAAAAAAFICGSDFALAQRVEGGGGVQGGASVQGGERGGAREDSGRSGGTQRSQPGMRERGGAEQKGSSARGAQGPERRDLTPGERGSNTRGAQGPERGRGTTGQADRAQERSGATSREQRGRDRGESSTTGQSERRDRTTGQSDRRFEGSNDRRDRSTTERGERSRTDTNVNVEINEQQRSRIRDVVVSRRNIPRVSNVNFDIRVGTVVPRTVRFVTVPEEIVRIYPRYRRHRIVIVGDEILIIDPVTFRIVAVLPA
jgi:Protein of unknown function (DUF1236)